MTHLEILIQNIGDQIQNMGNQISNIAMQIFNMGIQISNIIMNQNNINMMNQNNLMNNNMMMNGINEEIMNDNNEQLIYSVVFITQSGRKNNININCRRTVGVKNCPEIIRCLLSYAFLYFLQFLIF